MTGKERRLTDLASVGPAMLLDFKLLAVRIVTQLARRNPERMYEKLCQVTSRTQDICCLDVFRAAIAQAKNPSLPTERRLWWHWSRKPKATGACHEEARAEDARPCAPEPAGGATAARLPGQCRAGTA